MYSDYEEYEKQYFQRLIEVLKDEHQSRGRRASSAFALGAWENERSTQALLEALTYEDYLIVETAMFRLAWRGERRMLPLILQYKNSDDPLIVASVDRALAILEEQSKNSK